MRGTSIIRTLIAIVLLVGPAALSAGAADPPGTAPDPPDTAGVLGVGWARPDSQESVEPLVPRPDRVVVYYFHRTLRCETCLRFEAYTDEALRTTFADELGVGELEWHVVNLDDAGSEHFVDDYDITENSVVVVGFRGGEQREWTNLDAIWGCVADKPTFLSFIRDQVGERLSRARGPVPRRGSEDDSSVPSGDTPVGR